MESVSFACLMTFGAACAATAGPLTEAQYICDRNVAVPVSYLTAEDDNYAVLNIEGKQISLIQKVSASGARYGALEGEAGYIWWSKGETAFLAWAEDGKEDVILLDNCAS